MHWLARLRSWWYKLVPPAQREAREALTRQQLFQLARTFVEFQRLESRGFEADMVEAESISGSGPPMVMTREAVKASIAVVNSLPSTEQSVKLKERLLELELALDNIGWCRQLAYADLEFSRNGIQGIIKIARLYYLKNPLIKRAVEISGSYVFGRGFEVRSDDDAANAVIDAFMEANKAELGHIGMIEKEQTLRTDGNLFFLLFPSPTGGVSIRTIDAIEVQDIITDPDDASIPQYYRRLWYSKEFNPETGTTSTVQQECWYPALDYDPPVKRTQINGKELMWKSPMLHVKIGGLPKWLFGCPDIYSALDWAKAYKEFLENWSTITKALARFLWDAKTKGGDQTIQALQQVMNTSVASGQDGVGDFVDRNPPSGAGSTFIHSPGTELTPIKTANATTNPEQGRRVGMMVGSGVGLAETTLFGDASTGSLATAQSLDRPTELGMLRRQEHWREILGGRIIPYVLRTSASSPGGQLREAWSNAYGDKGTERAEHLVVKMVKRKFLERGKVVELWEAPDKRKNGDVSISVKFPAVLEHDIKSMVDAIVAATTLAGYAPAGTIDVKTAGMLVLAELGVEDPNAIMDAMYPTDKYEPEVVPPDEAAPVAQPVRDPAMQQRAQEARLGNAVRQLTEALERLGKR